MHVVVVGAGPCGLSLSLALAQDGIQVTLIDKGVTVDNSPRAVHLMVPAIQIFRRARVLDDVRRAGFLPRNSAFRRLDDSVIVKIEDIANAKSADATIVLPIGLLNEVLLPHAQESDKISLEWSQQVIDVGQDGDSAWAIVKDKNGSEKKIVGDYLVGCDGGTSRVRKSLLGDRNFPGKTWDVQFVATDIIYPFDRWNYDDVNSFVHPTEGHLVARLTKDGKWRVAYQEPKDMTYQEIVDNQPAHFERILPGNPKPGDYTVTNLSPYRLHQRCAEKFRVGRICLGGDAAHLCNPWGGLGLTGGFGDVMGLADCLAGIATGQADDSILDKYDQVRKSIFLNVVDPISTANFLRITTLASEEAIQKDPFFKMCEAATRDPQVQEKIQKSVYAICHDFTQYYSPNE